MYPYTVIFTLFSIIIIIFKYILYLFIYIIRYSSKNKNVKGLRIHFYNLFGLNKDNYI